MIYLAAFGAMHVMARLIPQPEFMMFSTIAEALLEPKFHHPHLEQRKGDNFALAS